MQRRDFFKVMLGVASVVALGAVIAPDAQARDATISDAIGYMDRQAMRREMRATRRARRQERRAVRRERRMIRRDRRVMRRQRRRAMRRGY